MSSVQFSVIVYVQFVVVVGVLLYLVLGFTRDGPGSKELSFMGFSISMSALGPLMVGASHLRLSSRSLILASFFFPQSSHMDSIYR